MIFILFFARFALSLQKLTNHPKTILFHAKSMEGIQGNPLAE